MIAKTTAKMKMKGDDEDVHCRHGCMGQEPAASAVLVWGGGVGGGCARDNDGSGSFGFEGKRHPQQQKQ